MVIIFRLLDILSSDCSLYLVFEYLEYDLKKYMDQFNDGLPPALVKVTFNPIKISMALRSIVGP